MAHLTLNKRDLQSLVAWSFSEKQRSEEVGVPLCRAELETIRKIVIARDKAWNYSQEVTDGSLRKLETAPTPLEEVVPHV